MEVFFDEKLIRFAVGDNLNIDADFFVQVLGIKTSRGYEAKVNL